MFHTSSQQVVRILKIAVAVLVVAASTALAAQRVRSVSTPRGDAAPAGFRISGGSSRPLRPGSTEVLDLKLSNPHRWTLLIHRVSADISVDAAHEKAGCYRTTHFRQTAIPARQYPLRLRPGSTRTLRQLGVTTLPTITMRDLPFDQRACQGARLRLRFAGLSARAGSARAR